MSLTRTPLPAEVAIPYATLCSEAGVAADVYGARAARPAATVDLRAVPGSTMTRE